ncbi:hypothetical protein V6N12_036294 [Hibiscus sabdariffa]|uniref:Reverse transcriptase zinc-binding domain-containing protein n=1 Tax=Hibiscus sabdariffa TaxID=183260 RepID=A0ABR2EQ89_9ROSI
MCYRDCIHYQKSGFFAWRTCHEALPVLSKLLAVGIGTGLCRLCEQCIETAVHALRDCPVTKEVLESSGVPVRIQHGVQAAVKDWFYCSCWSHGYGRFHKFHGSYYGTFGIDKIKRSTTMIFGRRECFGV